MSFQKCPICQGRGYTANDISSAVAKKCNTCNGTGIINELTGLPPKYSEIKNNLLNKPLPKSDCYNNIKDNTDFRDTSRETQQEWLGE